MGRLHLSAIPVVFVLVLLLPSLTFALSPFKVALNFMCACGTCDETLSECECPQSDGYRADLEDMVNRGMSEDQIISEFIDRFGASVLVANAAAAPPARSIGGRGGLSKQTVGIVLVVFGLSLAGMMMFRYARSAPQPSGRGRSSGKGRPPETRARKGSSGPERKKGRDSGFRDGDDDDLLDDYLHD
ncbi:MAG: hypothetical protein JSV26_03760 [bacterium]|nr:MAG: hypothetical protein JSV26_03760 [bacterium]